MKVVLLVNGAVVKATVYYSTPTYFIALINREDPYYEDIEWVRTETG